jgi:predicted N-formylglutamate amidohydrolase
MLERHGTQNAIPNVMIEVRNDLIKTADGQRDMAIMLAKVLNLSLQDLEPTSPRDAP